MKRLFAWVAGAAGGLAAVRALKGKRPRPEVEPGADGRAAELRARLQHARETADEQSGEAVAAPGLPDGAAQVDPEGLDPEARRAQVHEQGRAALDEMRGEST